MQVVVDDVWASPSTLHLRITVLADDGRWRHRYYPSVSLETIPVEAIAPLLSWFAEAGEDQQQLYLFDA